MELQTKHFYEFGSFRVDIAERMLLREGSPLQLSPKAFDTLLALLESAGRTLKKEELMKKVWPNTFVEEANLAVNISSIRKALGETPGGARFIETVPRRGYRFVAQVREVTDSPDTASTQSSTDPDQTIITNRVRSGEFSTAAALQPSLPGATSRLSPVPIRPTIEIRPRVRKWPMLVAALLLAAAPLTFWLIRRDSSPSVSLQPQSLAVLPFRNQKPDPETDYLGPSLADTITAKLGYVSAVSATIVRPASYVGKYSNQSLDPKALARELKVDALLTGSYIKEGDDLRISAELIDVRKDVSLWRTEINLKWDRLLTVQDQVSQQVLNGLQVRLSAAEAERYNRDAPTSSDAYEKFLHGVDLYQTNRFASAIQELEKAVALSPDWALAWAHLGRAHAASAAFHLRGRLDYDKAIECYRRALELNPQQNDARIFMANFLTDTGRVNEAVPLLREVLSNNSNLAEARWELGYAYRFGGMVEQSIAECELARKLNPAVKLYSSTLNAYLYNADYEKFLQSLPQSDIAYILFYRGLASYYQKDLQKAATQFDRAYELDENFYTRIGKTISYAIGGQIEQAQQLLRDTRQMIEERQVGDAEGIYKVAQAYALIGDKASALHVLKHSIDGGFFCYPYFVTDPMLASLRGEQGKPRGEPGWNELMDQARAKHEEFKRAFF
jgi:DNA-binding winged helix-turn-helix (wHTH) protein/TolB-like protein/lipopolysaccharide biosynthesis regulator YciM